MIAWRHIPDDTRCTRCGECKAEHHPAGYCATQRRARNGSILVVPGERPDRFAVEGDVVRFAPVAPTPAPYEPCDCMDCSINGEETH